MENKVKAKFDIDISKKKSSPSKRLIWDKSWNYEIMT